MHTFTVPDDADVHGVISNQLTGEPHEKLEFKDFWLAFMLPRVPRGNAAETECLVSLCDKLNECKAGDKIQWTDAEKEAACKSLPPNLSRENPGGIPSTLLAHTTKFFLAVQSAPKD